MTMEQPPEQAAPAQQVTIVTVAKAAGVSPATVSRVINGTRPVSEELRRRVETALAEHRFQPNPSARALKGHRTRTLGVVVSDFSNPFFTAVVRGVERVAGAASHTVVLCNSDERHERERQYLDLLRAKRIEGIILSPCEGSDPSAYEGLEHVPIVFIDREVSGVRADVVRVDNMRGARDAVAYLVGLGHERIATIAGPRNLTTGAERLRGYEEALREAGLERRDEHVLHGNFRQESGYQLARQVLELRPRPTALFVANNLMTLGAMVALNEAGVEVPQALSVIGFDDVDWAMLTQPPLTVVAQPAYDVGAASAELLLKRIDVPTSNQRQTVLLTPELIIRSSTAPPTT